MRTIVAISDQTMKLRGELFGSRETLLEQNNLLNRVQEELELLVEQESSLEQDYQAASDHLQLVQTALRQQEKIERYSEDLEELSERLEEQMMVVEEAQERVLLAEEQATITEEEVDSLKTQLADYQQALDVQQTRALQYQQAVQALEKTKQLLDDESITAEGALTLVSDLKTQEEQSTQHLLATKHKLDMSSAASAQFEKALSLVKSIVGTVERSEASQAAKQALDKGRNAKHIVENEQQWRAQHRDMVRDVAQQRQAKELAEEYQKQHNTQLNDEAVFEENVNVMQCRSKRLSMLKKSCVKRRVKSVVYSITTIKRFKSLKRLHLRGLQQMTH